MTLSPLYLAYRAATILGEPAARPLLRWRERSGKEDRARLGERMGLASRARPSGLVAWLHGASVGEGLALLPLVDALVSRGSHVLVTTGTVTSSRVMANRLPAGVTHQFVPLDFPQYLRRFLDHWRPSLVILAESELWPNLVHQVARRRIPLVLVNARMSDRSFRRWRRVAGFIKTLLDKADLCLAQTQEDAERFRRLGASRVAAIGNLKFDVAPPPADIGAVSDLSARIGARPVWVAASTHADEESLLLSVHQDVARDHPQLLTILVPRQPARGAAIAAGCVGRGIKVARRSLGEALPPAAGIYVADTIGELGLFYRVTDVVFLGKSLAGGGGQSPIEAAKLGNALLHGPLVGNFGEIYAALNDAGGALEVADANGLAEVLSSLLADPARLRGMARAAMDAVARQGGATGRIMNAIAPLLPAEQNLPAA